MASKRSILKLLTLTFLSFNALADEATNVDSFPIIKELQVTKKDGEFLLKLHQLPGEGYGYAMSVWRDGYILQMEIINGVAPTIIDQATGSPEHIGLLYKEGGHQSTLEILSFQKKRFTKVAGGEIGSNCACVFLEDDRTLSAVDVDHVNVYIKRYKITVRKIIKIDERKIPKHQVEQIRGKCETRSLF
ncbi:hypothetical protein [Massilia sp. YIM B04103]|uniref:hypothetical protein n=1 Tax=Massilia sp. YIM B04103 TaxID=2963106 RepID=UPI00210C39A6|nr:hypothetical protein [Massilia sp. YIM B04103]